MDKTILKDLYDLYTRDIAYINQITSDPEFQIANKKIFKAQQNLSKLLHIYFDENTISKVLDEINDAYMNLIEIYQYHDFVNGIVTGISLHQVLTDNQSTDLSNKIEKMIQKYQ